MDKYTPELIMVILSTLYNITLIIACTWGIVSLYKESHSWNSLWLLLMLLCLSTYKFIRD